MPDGKPDRNADDHGRSRWAAVNLTVALMLVLAIGSLIIRAHLTDAAGLGVLTVLGVLALVSAGLLFHSFLRR